MTTNLMINSNKYVNKINYVHIETKSIFVQARPLWVYPSTKCTFDFWRTFSLRTGVLVHACAIACIQGPHLWINICRGRGFRQSGYTSCVEGRGRVCVVTCRAGSSGGHQRIHLRISPQVLYLLEAAAVAAAPAQSRGALAWQIILLIHKTQQSEEVTLLSNRNANPERRSECCKPTFGCLQPAKTEEKLIVNAWSLRCWQKANSAA